MLEFSLDARRGSFHLQVECYFASDWTVIFGPSGAGKSTLLRLLAGLDSPMTTADIVLDGRALTETASACASRPATATPRWSRSSPRSSLTSTLKPTWPTACAVSTCQPARRVDEMLDLVGATDLAFRRPQDLSGGQAQRVALARALAPAPASASAR